MSGRFHWTREQTGWRARYVLRSAEGMSEVYAVQRQTGEQGTPTWNGRAQPHQEYYGWAYRAAGEDQQLVDRQLAEASSDWYQGYSQRAMAAAALLRRRRREPDAPFQDRPRVYHHAKEAIKACEDVIIARRLKQAEMPVLPLCLVCRHLVWSNATPGYSEYTPGDSFYVSCGKGYWQFDQYDEEPAQWARKIQSAESCNDFDPTQQIRRGAMVVPADTADQPSRGRRTYNLVGDEHE